MKEWGVLGPLTTSGNVNRHNLPEEHMTLLLNIYSAVPLLESYPEKIIMNMREILALRLLIKMLIVAWTVWLS